MRDVFLVVWRRIDEVPQAGESLPWLYGVGRNVPANRARSFGRRDRLTAQAAQTYEDPVPGAGATACPQGGELPVGGTIKTINTVESGGSLRSLEALKTGHHTVDCVHFPLAATNPDHMWRAGTVEVVP